MEIITYKYNVGTDSDDNKYHYVESLQTVIKEPAKPVNLKLGVNCKTIWPVDTDEDGDNITKTENGESCDYLFVYFDIVEISEFTKYIPPVPVDARLLNGQKYPYQISEENFNQYLPVVSDFVCISRNNWLGEYNVQELPLIDDFKSLPLRVNDSTHCSSSDTILYNGGWTLYSCRDYILDVSIRYNIPEPTFGKVKIVTLLYFVFLLINIKRLTIADFSRLFEKSDRLATDTRVEFLISYYIKSAGISNTESDFQIMSLYNRLIMRIISKKRDIISSGYEKMMREVQVYQNNELFKMVKKSLNDIMFDKIDTNVPDVLTSIISDNIHTIGNLSAKLDDIVKGLEMLKLKDSFTKGDAVHFYKLVPFLLQDYNLYLKNYGVKMQDHLSNPETRLKYISELESILENYTAYSEVKGKLLIEPDQSVKSEVVRLFYDGLADQAKFFKVSEIYSVVIYSQREKWNNRLNPSENIKHLWHGTSRQNVLSLLNQGFVLSHPTARVTGKMFGNGIYFAPLALKSLFYSDDLRNRCPKGEKMSGWIFLNLVDLGREFSPNTAAPPPNLTDYDSVYAKADSPITIRGGRITRLLNDEAIVYDSSRVLTTHIVKISCV